VVICLGLLSNLAFADEKKPEPKKEDQVYDFEHEETFMDVPDALRSRQFVHRAILSTIIRDTAKVQLGSFYVNHLMGFSAVYQPANQGGKSFAKYVSGVIGFAGGYSTEGGHTFELGFDLSSNSNIYLSYRKFLSSENATFWPYVGMGLGMEMAAIRLTDIPVEAKAYQGKDQFAMVVLGTLIPLVDIAIKAEARFVLYGLDRLMLTTGAGVVFFL